MSSYICLTPYNMDFPADTNSKEPACQETQGMPWVRALGQEDPLKEEWQPTPMFLPAESHGQRSLAGYNAQDCKELDTTEMT